MYLYWIVSDVVEARSLVIRILTMLKRKMKLICETFKDSNGRRYRNWILESEVEIAH